MENLGGTFGWKIWVENWGGRKLGVENLGGNLGGKFGWKIWVDNLGGKFGVEN